MNKYSITSPLLETQDGFEFQNVSAFARSYISHVDDVVCYQLQPGKYANHYVMTVTTFHNECPLTMQFFIQEQKTKQEEKNEKV